VLQKVRIEKRALGAFNVYNMESVMAVMQAAQNLKAPVIIAFGESYFSYAPVEIIAGIVKELAGNMDVPIVLHLDHARNPDSIIKAIKCGFTSVMYDGSAYEFYKNIEKTKRIVDLAHEAGVSVEGELGYLNNEDGNVDLQSGIENEFTKPEEAIEFAQTTGIDALAIAIGNSHGLYKGIPILNMDILEQINKAVNIPLVLHGCSGIPDDMLVTAVSLGVCKINVNTEISTGAVQTARQFLNFNKDSELRFEKVLSEVRNGMIEKVEKYIRLLQNS